MLLISLRISLSSECNNNNSIAANAGRIYLKRYPLTDEDSDYISAVYVDGVKLQNQYIATQLPLPETFSDFWRMIAEYKVELIIMLQLPDLKDAVSIMIKFLLI